MAHNDEAGGSGKPFWELSQEMEEEPHRYEDAAEDTDPDYTTPSGVGDDTTDGAAGDSTTDDGSERTNGSQPKKQREEWRRTGSAPPGRNLLKCPPVGIQRHPKN